MEIPTSMVSKFKFHMKDFIQSWSLIERENGIDVVGIVSEKPEGLFNRTLGFLEGIEVMRYEIQKQREVSLKDMPICYN